jgi:hypothetical protein
MRSRAGETGLTLVELMIAIGLMLIMTLQLQIVFGHSRKLYLGADAMAQVYSNARAAMDQIEKDISNAVKTDQMEFFNDNPAPPPNPGAGHYNPGEENPTLRGKFIPGQPYLAAMTFRQRKDYPPKDKAKVGGDYRHDSMYFRTFTTVMGQAREVLIEYRLWLGNDPWGNPLPRPILQRIVTGPQINPTTGMPVYDAAGNPLLERREPQDICYYVQEFKVDFYIRDKRRKNVGRFYSPKEAILKAPTADDPRPPAMENLMGGSSDDVAVQCLDGKHDVDNNATISTTDGKLYLRNQDKVPRLAPGDKLYLISRPLGNFRVDFNAKYLTIKDIAMPTPGETVVSFEEEAAMKQYLAQNSQNLPAIEMAYRGGWLPEAIRVQMKIKDQRSQEVRTLTRIFQLLKA